MQRSPPSPWPGGSAYALSSAAATLTVSAASLGTCSQLPVVWFAGLWVQQQQHTCFFVLGLTYGQLGLLLFVCCCSAKFRYVHRCSSRLFTPPTQTSDTCDCRVRHRLHSGEIVALRHRFQGALVKQHNDASAGLLRNLECHSSQPLGLEWSGTPSLRKPRGLSRHAFCIARRASLRFAAGTFLQRKPPLTLTMWFPTHHAASDPPSQSPVELPMCQALVMGIPVLASPQVATRSLPGEDASCT
jgi:hypothetical protein